MGSRATTLAVVAIASFATFFALTAVFWIGANSAGEDTSDPLWTRIVGVAAGPAVLPAGVLAAGVCLLLAGLWLEARFLLLAVVGAGVLMYAVRVLLQVLGADDDGGRLSDFPSGHVSAATALAGALTVLAWSRWKSTRTRVLVAAAAGGLVVVVGWARIASGHHTLVDVMGGVALTLSWLAVCLVALPPAEPSPLGRRGTSYALLAIGLAGFAFLAVLYDREPLGTLDLEVAEHVPESVPGWLEALARPFTWLGGGIGLAAMGLVAGVVLVRARAWLDLGFFLAAFLGSQLVVVLLKGGFDRPRPHAGSAVPLPDSASFPSGHAMGGAASLGALAVLASERLPSARAHAWLWSATLALGVGVGLSRIVLNVHYVTDVVAGWCLGAAWLAGCLLVRDALRGRSRRV